jgi:hemoglobin
MMDRSLRSLCAVGGLSFALAIVGCESAESTAKPAIDKTKMALGNTPLYERLGGEPAITAVVDDFVARSAANPAVNFTRKDTPKEWQATPENVDHLKKMLVQMICQEAGGPHKYKGRDMGNVHTGMDITAAEFDALAADLKASLDKFRVPPREQDELLAIVGGTRGAIVGR